MRSMTSSSARRADTYVSPSSHSDRAPVVAVGRVHLAQRRRDDLDVAGASSPPCRSCRRTPSGRASTLRHVRPGDARGPSASPLRCRRARPRSRRCARHVSTARSSPPDDLPELRAVVQVERGDRAGGLRRLHPLDDQLGGRLGERREDAAASGTSARRPRRLRPSRSRRA